MVSNEQKAGTKNELRGKQKLVLSSTLLGIRLAPTVGFAMGKEICMISDSPHLYFNLIHDETSMAVDTMSELFSTNPGTGQPQRLPWPWSCSLYKANSPVATSCRTQNRSERYSLLARRTADKTGLARAILYHNPGKISQVVPCVDR
jgi:hypothetical protein